MTISEPKPVSRSNRLAAIIAGIIALAILIGLGSWQVARLHWKEALLASIAERQAATPASVDEIEQRVMRNTLPDVDYYPVRVTGTFLHAGERHFFATWKGQTGFYVYTPMQLQDGRFVFVNRGFVPYDLKDPTKRTAGQVEGPVTVTGLSRNVLTAKPSSLVPENEPAKNVFYWKDIQAMQTTAGLPEGARVLPFFIDANDAPNPGGLPVGGVTMIDLPNNHLQYAMTWFGLAAALAGVLGVWLWRSRGSVS